MPTKKVFDYILYAVLFLIFFFLSALVSSQMILKGEIVTIPDLVGKTLPEAESDLAKKKLGLVQTGSQFSNSFEKGRIIFQEPAAGSKIKVHKTVRVLVSEGSEMVEVPRVVGMSQEAASQIFLDVGLVKGKISQIHTPRYAAGRIMAQEPPPGEAKVKRNTPMNLLVSQGEREEKFIMPDLIGRQYEEVIAELRAAEFKITNIRYARYPGLGPGIIIKQFPSPGYPIQKRNFITLEVSKS